MKIKTKPIHSLFCVSQAMGATMKTKESEHMQERSAMATKLQALTTEVARLREQVAAQEAREAQWVVGEGNIWLQ